jgi:hypothetical protein
MKTSRLISVVLLLASVQWVAADVTITTQPKNASVSLGATAPFTVTASSTAPPISFQWWFKDTVLDVKANPSAATSRLSLTNVTLASAGAYSVVASDRSGSATSQIAILSVDPTFTKVTTGPVVTDVGSSINNHAQRAWFWEVPSRRGQGPAPREGWAGARCPRFVVH